MLNEKPNEKFIDMTELCDMLKASDMRTAIKWCKDNGLDILTICKRKVAYRFMVEMELDKALIKQLKEKHPDNWEELYKCYRENDRFEYIMLLYEKKLKTGFKTKATPRSKFAKEFVEQLNT